MKLHKLLVLAVLFICGTSLLFSAGGRQDSQQAGGPIVLQFITNQVTEGDPGAVAIANRVREFNQAYTGRYQVNIVGIPEHTQMIQRLQTNVAADVPMDLFWVINDIRSPDFWGSGYLADLTPYIDSEFRSWKSDEHWADVTSNGEVLGVPYFSTLIGMYYNKQIFAEAGVQLPIRNWDEFFVAADKIKAAGYIPIALDTLNTAWLTMLNYSAYVGGSLGPDYLTGITNFNDPAFSRGAEFLMRMLDYTSSDVVGVIYNVAANYFIEGQAAMIPNGGWMIGQFPAEFQPNVGVMPFPGQTRNSNGLVIDGPIAKLVTSHHNTRNPARMEAIVAFMRFFSQPDNIRKTIIESGSSYTGTVTFGPSDPLNPILKELFNASQVADYSIPRIRDTVPDGFYSGFEQEIARLWTRQTTVPQFIRNLNRVTFED